MSSSSAWKLAMQVSPCKFVVNYARGYHCATHGLEVDAREERPVACDGFYKNLKLLNQFYSEAYLAGMRAANRTYPTTPEID